MVISFQFTSSGVFDEIWEPFGRIEGRSWAKKYRVDFCRFLFSQNWKISHKPNKLLQKFDVLPTLKFSLATIKLYYCNFLEYIKLIIISLKYGNNIEIFANKKKLMSKNLLFSNNYIKLLQVIDIRQQYHYFW